jgi:hypothetical protein
LDEKTGEWIDPAVSRMLLLEYQHKLGVKGASQIERDIHDHAKEDLDRKTIENWLKGTGSVTSHITLQKILKFLRTGHFAKIIPSVADYLNSDSRLLRLGSAIMELYGAEGLDIRSACDKNAYLGGWWRAQGFMEDKSHTNYLYLVQVSDQPFSKILISLVPSELTLASGVAFPVSNGNKIEFSARVWGFRKSHYEKALTITLAPEKGNAEETLLVLFESKDSPLPSPLRNIVGARFMRLEERSVPEQVRQNFHQLSQDVLPRRNAAGQINSN